MPEKISSFHFSDLIALLPGSFFPIFITLALSFLIGLEREEHAGKRQIIFGGVRTFPIIGLCGYILAKLSPGQPLVIGFGVLAIGALLALSYRKKLEHSSNAGMTSEISGLFTFLLGALVFEGSVWEATALAVIVLLLLELKSGLEALARKIPTTEVFTFTRFLLITAVILPIVPNQEFTSLHFNPFHAWLIVVAISGLSYGAYILERLIGSGKSLVAAAVLGGVYSSTSTTIVLSRRSKDDQSTHMFSGAIVLASGLMYFRLVALLSVFNWNLGKALLVPFGILGVLFALIGIFWMKFSKDSRSQSHSKLSSRNPLELQSALVFAGLFSLMGVLTAYAIKYFGATGVLGLSFLSGLTDVDPFVMSLTQSSGTVISEQVAIHGVIVATASNNVMKGVYAYFFGADGVKNHCSAALIALALFSLIALFFV